MNESLYKYSHSEDMLSVYQFKNILYWIFRWGMGAGGHSFPTLSDTRVVRTPIVKKRANMGPKDTELNPLDGVPGSE